MERFRALESLPTEQLMAGFTRLQLAPGVEPPAAPEGPAPPWMAKRPAGVRAFINAFDNVNIDLEALRSFERPVYFALGGRSNPDFFARIAERLAAIFPDFTLETFAERHHFDPPHRVEPERLANSLLALWQRAEPRNGPLGRVAQPVDRAADGDAGADPDAADAAVPEAQEPAWHLDL